jgi:hypothetical protein
VRSLGRELSLLQLATEPSDSFEIPKGTHGRDVESGIRVGAGPIDVAPVQDRAGDIVDAVGLSIAARVLRYHAP